MKIRFTKNYPIIAVFTFSFLMVCFALNAQTTFYTEDFSDGDLPAGWTTDDPSGNGILWTYCADPNTGAGMGCHRIWDDGLNEQGPFMSTTADNGFITVDSDAAGNVTHQSRITSAAINASGESTVVLRMETQIGVFTIDAEVGAFVQVSNDGGTSWDDYTLFPGLITGSPDPPLVRWSFNPQIVEVDISATAANQSAVLLRFVWDANYEYHWNIDDIALQDMLTPDPTSETELGAGFHAPSWATPSNHIVPIDLAGLVTNNGIEEQTNVTLNAVITNSGGTEVYNDSGVLPALPVGTVDTLIATNSQYTPPSNPEQYDISYTLTQDSMDQDPANNTFANSFVITPNLFSKDNGIIVSGSANAVGGTYEFGNFYELAEADSAVSIIFGIGKNDADGPIDGESVTLYLFKVECDLGTADCVTNFSDDSVSLQGIAFYTFPDETPDLEDYTETEVELLTWPDFSPGPIALEPGVYIAMVSIIGNGVDNTIFVGTADPGYADGQLASVVREQATGVFPSPDADWFLAGFGPQTIAFCRLRVAGTEPPVSIFQPEELQATMSVFPNPADKLVNLDFALEQETERLEITILDVKGRTVHSEEYQNIRSQVFEFDVSNYAAGTYYMSVSTEEGVKTSKFNVVH